MIEQLKTWDYELFRWLNGTHNSFFDFLMPWVSNKWIWVPLYLLLFYAMVKYSPFKLWQILLGCIVLIFFSDQLASGVLKPWVGRLRPCYDPILSGKVHLLKGCGGQYGFASSHAANSFAVATFCFMMLKPHFKKLHWLFFWAAFVAYSRVYMGVHFFGDILVGAIIGLAAGLVSFELMKFLNRKT